MPFYYDYNRACTTNGTTLTLSTHFWIRTAANQKVARLTGLYGSARNAAAGGGTIIGTRAGTIGSGGTAIAAPNGIGKVNPDSPAADTLINTDASAITPGATPMVQLTVGIAQTGGQGGWVPLEQDDAPLLKPNAGANGNFEIGSLAVGLSQVVHISGRFSE